MPRTPNTPKNTPEITPEIQAILDRAKENAAAQEAQDAKIDALLPKPKRAKIKTLRTFYDKALLLKLAQEIGPEGDWLDLGHAYQDAGGANGADWDDDDSYHGPKLRTRLSQLTNSGDLPENFRPIQPGDKALYLAEKDARAIAQEAQEIALLLAAHGLAPDGSPLTPDASPDAGEPSPAPEGDAA